MNVLMFLVLLFQPVTYGTAAITVPVPPIQQPNNYSCEVACTASLLTYFGKPIDSYSGLEHALRANRKEGTYYLRTAKYLESKGLEVEIVKGMSLTQLENEVMNKRRPVMMSIQAYGNKAEYSRNINGHEVICIGKLGDKWVFMDPSQASGSYGWMSQSELLERWHDLELDGVIQHLGVIVWSKEGRRAIALHID